MLTIFLVNLSYSKSTLNGQVAPNIIFFQLKIFQFVCPITFPFHISSENESTRLENLIVCFPIPFHLRGVPRRPAPVRALPIPNGALRAPSVLLKPVWLPDAVTHPDVTGMGNA